MYIPNTKYTIVMLKYIKYHLKSFQFSRLYHLMPVKRPIMSVMSLFVWFETMYISAFSYVQSKVFFFNFFNNLIKLFKTPLTYILFMLKFIRYHQIKNNLLPRLNLVKKSQYWPLCAFVP